MDTAWMTPGRLANLARVLGADPPTDPARCTR
jgi:hypothetical protein